MRKRLLAALLGTAMVVSLFAGCGSKAPAKEEGNDNPGAQVETQAPEVETEEPAEILPDGMARSYTTGLMVTTEEAQKRPVAMMVPEDKAAQPQYGISLADVVYEFEAEGGISRQMMIYSDYSGLEKWGNIRSAREYFIATALAWDAIYIHFGGAAAAYDIYFFNNAIDDIDFYEGPFGPYFFRSKDKKAPHNAYTSTDLIDKCIEKMGYETTVREDKFDGYFKFNKDDANEIELADGQAAAAVSGYFRYSKPYYVYDDSTKLYTRYIHGEKQVDGFNNQAMEFKNIILQYTEVESYLDSQNHDRVDIDIVGSGRGLYATNGKAIPITWQCDGDGLVTHYYTADGKELVINQGKTMVAVIDFDDEAMSGAYASLDDLKAARK